MDERTVETCECGHPVDSHDLRGQTGDCRKDCPECRPCKNGHCVRPRGHVGYHVDRRGQSWEPVR